MSAVQTNSAGVKSSSCSLTSKSNSSITMSRSIENEEPVSEEKMLAKGYVTPDDVLQLKKITSGYLCSPDANVYDIDFTRFCIRDLESGTILFEIAKPLPPGLNFFVNTKLHSTI